VDYAQVVPGDHVPYGAMLDLFFRSHFDPDVRSSFGKPETINRIPNFHPCLRIDFKLVPDYGNPRKTMIGSKIYVHSQRLDRLPNSTMVKVQPTHTMSFGYDGKVHTYAGQQSDALDIMHLAMTPLNTYNHETLPNFFRAGGDRQSYVKALWGFYRLYDWTSVLIMYGMSEKTRWWFEVFVELASLEEVPPSYIIGAALSETLPLQTEGILDQMRGLMEKPCRLLFHFVDIVTQHIIIRGIAFVDQIFRYQNMVGLWIPKYQIVGTRALAEMEPFVKNATFKAMFGRSSYGSLFFVETNAYAPDVLADLLPAILWWVGKTGGLAAVDLNARDSQERFGLTEWQADTFQYVLRKFNNNGGLIGMLFSGGMTYVLSSWAKQDFISRFVLAHSCFLHEGGSVRARDAPLFRHCMRDVGSEKNLHHFGVPWPLNDKQNYENYYSVMGPVYVFDPTTNTSFQEFYNPVVVTDRVGFSKAGRYTGQHMPVWANGISSDDPPDELNKCTGGRMRNKLGSCDWCPPGRFSNTTDMTACLPCDFGRYSAGSKEACDFCPAGKAASEPASQRCSICSPGRYSYRNGSAACDSCPIGAFSDESGAIACQKCNVSYTTEHIASDHPTMCKCRRGSYLSGTRCLECMKGLACVDGWPNNWATEGGTVVLESNHYSFESAPYDTYQCRHQGADGSCPGGAPQQPCHEGLTGFLCTTCSKSGSHIVNGMCKPCAPQFKYMLLHITLVFLVIIVACYYLSNSPLAVNAGHKQDIAVFLGLAITIFQILGVLKGLEVQWPIDMYDFMDSSSSVFTLDAQSISLTCAVGDKAVVQYLVQALIPYFIMAETAFIGIATKIIFPALGRARKAWTFSKSMNVIGQLFQALFIAFCQIMVRPLQCYPHPNGKKSVVMFSQVLCWDSEDHTSLTIIAAGIFLFFILPFAGWCVWGCWKAPVKSSEGDIAFLQMFRFLFYRFRPDCWWWGLVFLIRQTCLAAATILPSSNAHAQLFVTGGVLAIYVCLAAMFWPWISTELSIMDSGSCLVLVLLLICSSQFLPSAAEPGSVSLLVILFMALACVICRYLAIFVISMCSNGVNEEVCGETPNRLDLCQQWFEFVDVMRNQNTKDTIETICKMNTFDRYRVLSLMHTWSANGQLASCGRKLPPRLSNIRSRTTLDEEAVGTAGKRVSQIVNDSRSLGSGSRSMGSGSLIAQDLTIRQSLISEKGQSA